MSAAVTVLTSCYNAQEYLAESIESVLAQKWRDFGFLLIDDGSTDSTPELLHRYADADSRIRVIIKRNTGLADSLNYGLKETKSEWVARIDADDVWLPDRLLRQMRFVQKYPDTVLLGSGCVEIDGNGRRLKTHRYPSTHKALLKHLMTLGKFPAHSSMLLRKTTVDTLGGYRSKLYGALDLDLWIRLSKCGRIASLTEPLVLIRKHSDSMSQRDTKTEFLAMAIAVGYNCEAMGMGNPCNCEGSTWYAYLTWLENELNSLAYFQILQSWASLRNRLLAQTRNVRFIESWGKAMEFASSFPEVIRTRQKRRRFLKLPRILADSWDQWTSVNNSRSANFSE